MTIRKYHSADKERLIELFRLNTPQYFSPIEEEGLRHYLDHQSALHFVAEADGVVTGCGGYLFIDEGSTALICWDFVHPQMHGKGIGSALMRHRIRQICEIPGISTLRVRTSQLVYPFYERFGLELREVVKDYWDTGFDLYLLECAIVKVRD